MHNARLGIGLLDAIVERRQGLDLGSGARRWARRRARERGRRLVDGFLYNAFGRGGWMVPNQYWSPGVLAPMPIMGKYYMHYGTEFLPPRELGRRNAQRFVAELSVDNLGTCRFHRRWAEQMLPEIMGSLYGLKDEYLERCRLTAIRIGSRNAAVYWESARSAEFVHGFLRRRHEVAGDRDPSLVEWLDRFERDRDEAALEFWHEMRKGTDETLREL
jgi:glyceraldehyde-3-phosphate dehydrogenase (ferredoxin)